MKAPQEFAENERKRGEPGYVEVFAQERTLTHRIIRPDRVTDQGFGIYGEEAPLEQPVAHTDFVGTAKFYNTHYEWSCQLFMEYRSINSNYRKY